MKFKLIFFIINCILLCNEEPYVLVVSLDGFRYDYQDKANTPHLDYIQKNGVKANSLKPIFPSLTFPNHYSIATGCYSNEHKITGNKFYSKEYNQYYSYKNPETVQNGKFYGCEPLWVTTEKNGIKSATFFWIGSEAEIKGYRPSIYKKYNSKIDFKSRIDSAMYWIDLPQNISPRLIMLYFNEPDHTGHNKGPNSLETLNTIEKMDSIMGYLLKEIDNRKKNKNINLIILSDHGMSEVNSNNIIVLDEYLTNLNQFDIYGSGSFVQIDRKTSFKNINLDIFNKIPNVRFYEKHQIPNQFNFKNINSGEILIVANEGYLLGEKDNLNNSLFKLKGMHGYDPENKNMHGIFYAIGPVFKKGIKVKSFENIYIYSLICEIFNIKTYKNNDNYNNFSKKNILK